MDVIPLFKSHYSLGRSILTLESAGNSPEDGPDSIVDIAKSNKLKEVFLVDDSMGGFLEAYTNLAESKIKLIFGTRLTICEDHTKKNEEAISTSSKYVIFCKNKRGYERLIKIYSEAAKEGFYYEPRTDFTQLKKYWANEDLLLAVPFYDSFIYYNNLSSRNCIPDFSFCDPVFFTEENDLPYDNILLSLVESYVDGKHQMRKCKSVYYKDKAHFKAYLTFRCINNRSTLEKPELNNMCSDTFCLESWKELVNG